MTLAISQYVEILLVVAFVAVSVGLIFIVLLQRPSGGGLGGAFGAGSGSGQTAFGTKTGDVLTGSTIALFAIWLLLAIGLNYLARPGGPPDRAAIMQGQEEPTEGVGAEVPPPAVPGGSARTPGEEPEAPTDPDRPAPERLAGPDGDEGEGG